MSLSFFEQTTITSLAVAAAGHLDLHQGQHPGIVAVVVVLTFAVATQIHLPLERLFAEAAGERLVARVFAHVGDEIRALAERLCADDALVGLLACSGEEEEKKKGIDWSDDDLSGKALQSVLI